MPYCELGDQRATNSCTRDSTTYGFCPDVEIARLRQACITEEIPRTYTLLNLKRSVALNGRRTLIPEMTETKKIPDLTFSFSLIAAPVNRGCCVFSHVYNDSCGLSCPRTNLVPESWLGYSVTG